MKFILLAMSLLHSIAFCALTAKMVLPNTYYAEDVFRDYHVIQRTSETHAGLSLKGTYAGGLPAHIQIKLIDQEDTSCVQGYNWTSIESAISGGQWTGSTLIPVGGEYKILFRSIDASETELEVSDTAEHVLVGDIWAASGQSNMCGRGDLVDVEPSIPYVHHMIDMYRRDGCWQVAAEPIASTTHGLILRFAKEVYYTTGIPIGLIASASGGQSITYWDKAQTSYSYGYAPLLRTIDAAGGIIKGMIWYQGESDTDSLRSCLYKERTVAFFNNVRGDVENPQLPIVLAQIGGETAYGDGRWWMHTRNEQRLIAEEDSNAACVSVFDLPRKDNVHLSTPGYKIAGVRFARAALKLAYAMDTLTWGGPRFDKAFFIDDNNDKIVVVFSGVRDSLQPSDTIKGLFVLDSLGGALVRSAISGISLYGPNSVLIFLESSASANALVGYGDGFDPIKDSVNLTDGTGIPAQLFYYEPIAESGTVKSEDIVRLRGNIDPEPVLTAQPNPFNPRTRIMVRNIGLREQCQGMVYSVTGTVVWQFSAIGSQLLEGIVWDAGSLPSGIYLVKASVWNKTISKRIIYLK
ncbi:MAG: hypothetical protein A2487_05945 [Candidatus Raymondbacteria bacterium RifOxyC12_full_50_8]|uniref:Sialate O-acetylesterase domain-containing protein n=1 Tax=Candidatus Raymondbacteria bacterium RIFOXYD12_FULL_49_13 TaxID=1817890 RepID=A0A1F7F348_UNCRA|nr:MAG: hypothetical protein A2248_10065 [Candidatus Raymondbacteria bacterium RIFOXYA2_FULL_49_16]OGJ86196.1 MAG: hypothetical protein A2350_18790 [Candidatus Raymondbacteria bacterium RifOxyB12_full_50_8]OGJ93559.1 MAG: hypothetical protein A2487_05945 [Candidatus Raymondbacteria bacterium RifOxyC12_full_50_8]OGK01104.1 MAG: hypothetical protein A2519_20315 [Candidatus Raymondbacteria bacterium RIFOXYD12_FULL_49_13]OGP39314.1 MAG: hypothetical protein A2324_02445 [Candidatus Raymondbacteria b